MSTRIRRLPRVIVMSAVLAFGNMEANGSQPVKIVDTTKGEWYDFNGDFVSVFAVSG